jgi:hypothetical protein
MESAFNRPGSSLIPNIHRTAEWFDSGGAAALIDRPCMARRVTLGRVRPFRFADVYCPER